MKRSFKEPKYSDLEVVAILFICFISFRLLAGLFAKISVHYWTRGDDAMRKRFEGLARHFAPMGFLHGELGLEAEAPKE